MGFCAFTGIVVSTELLDSELLAWPFRLLLLGLGGWAVLASNMEDYTLIALTLMLVLMLVAGLAWIGSRLF